MPSLAIDVGTDLRAHALALARARYSVLSGQPPDLPIRPEILESWERCAEAGVSPDHGIALYALGVEEAVERWKRHPFAAAEHALQHLRQLTADAHGVIVVCDVAGNTLWCDGDPFV